ncbi:MAG: GNAT family N-acetyltransferase [Pseudomonadota bacterium]
MQIQRARPEDVAFLKRIAIAAFSPYIRRIGRKPAPMQADFPALVAAGEVWTLSHMVDIVGYIVMRPEHSSLHVENVAVHPEQHGHGFGRALMDFAEGEARRQGLERLDLYTNAKMRENAAFYSTLGWQETARRNEQGFERIYFGKSISS